MKSRIRIAFGFCSYGVALVLLLVPFFSGPETAGGARIVPFLSGALLLAGAILTDFELGLAKVMRFRDTVSLTILGCIGVMLSVLVLSYGQMLWLILMLASCQGSMALMAYKTHHGNRQHPV